MSFNRKLKAKTLVLEEDETDELEIKPVKFTKKLARKKMPRTNLAAESDEEDVPVVRPKAKSGVKKRFNVLTPLRAPQSDEDDADDSIYSKDYLDGLRRSQKTWAGSELEAISKSLHMVTLAATILDTPTSGSTVIPDDETIARLKQKRMDLRKQLNSKDRPKFVSAEGEAKAQSYPEYISLDSDDGVRAKEEIADDDVEMDASVSGFLDDGVLALNELERKHQELKQKEEIAQRVYSAQGSSGESSGEIDDDDEDALMAWENKLINQGATTSTDKIRRVTPRLKTIPSLEELVSALHNHLRKMEAIGLQYQLRREELAQELEMLKQEEATIAGRLDYIV
ncbi:hypothetical protein BABINDRAFT_7980 [Babjeviella inositovora NRRL Y-12698]|uniref:Uncharacterized protein n=1 Tax=Babjeviella inositovora NRRL Y-12698 TaxID=984486 RepID=A0A1E3QPZ2_9ASCO|nr:uncharacterized protein BABINDRAFT_7980 [Babjeviella inositovora NRRL Y-12698]ODQ79776.1 hypothetical protein BABINDRAFT_7980 [Babjeviella inositovora NRRL Y-12698]